MMTDVLNTLTISLPAPLWLVTVIICQQALISLRSQSLAGIYFIIYIQSYISAVCLCFFKYQTLYIMFICQLDV